MIDHPTAVFSAAVVEPPAGSGGGFSIICGGTLVSPTDALDLLVAPGSGLAPSVNVDWVSIGEGILESDAT